jgi:cytoskeleton protein RodZ
MFGSDLTYVENIDAMATVSTPTSEDRRAQVLRPGTLGQMLRRARELRGLTLERIANETKIPQRHLEALERDNLTAIPTGFYGRAELRTYAQAVGLDQRLALAELESALAPPAAREPREPRSDKEPATSPLPYIAMAVIAIGVVAALFGRASVDDTLHLAPVAGAGGPVASSPQPSVPSPEATQPPAAAIPPPETATPAAAVPTDAAVQPAQAPAVAVAVTELVVTTEPEGARITVNGIGWGSSPATIQYLEPGQKRVRVSKEGYAAVERVLQVDAGRRQTFSVQLEPVE